MKSIDYHYNIIKSDPIIFSFPNNYHFGDKIASLNMHVYFSKILNRDTFLSIKDVKSSCDLYIAKLFFDNRLVIEPATYNTFISDVSEDRDRIFEEIYKNKYHIFPSRNDITGDLNVCYSFDCVYKSELKKPAYIENLIDHLKTKFNNVNFIHIGKHLGVEESLNMIQKSKCVISVDNGISHLTRCTNTKLLLIEYLFPVNRGHPSEFYKNYKTCKSVEDLFFYLNQNV